MEAFENLDARGDQLPRDEIIEKLKLSAPSADDSPWWPKPEGPQSLLELSNAFCYSESKMDKVKEALRITKWDSKALYELMEGILDHQRRLCEQRFLKEVDDYESKKPDDILLIQDLEVCYDKIDPIDPYFGTRVLTKFLEMKLPEDEQQCEKLAEAAGIVANRIMGPCRELKDHFRSWFEYANKFDSRFRF